MNYAIFFSPTGMTKKVVEHIGGRFQSPEAVDLSGEGFKGRFQSDDFCVFGVPSFGGRVPNIAAERLKRLGGENTPAFLTVTYGARAYEDTLKELQMILEARGFRTVAAAAIISRHAIVPKIAAKRPGEKDFAELDGFIEQVKERLKTGTAPLHLPGNTPFKAYQVMPMDIEATEDCVRCGVCAKHCPAGAIPFDEPQRTDHEKCISCMRCTVICPFYARKANEEKVAMLYNKLKAIDTEKKKNEFF